jgi:hypothetical protein
MGILERLLRSAAGRILLVATSVTLLAGANTLELSSALAGRSFGPALDEGAFFLSQLTRWGLWGVMALLGIVPLMQLSGRWGRPQQALAHLLLAAASTWTVGAAWSALRPELPSPFDFSALEELRGDRPGPPRGERGDRGERLPSPEEQGEDLGDRPPRRQGRFDPRRGRGAFGREDDTLDRWLTHGLLLLLCAGGASHLRSEEARRRAAALAIERAQLVGELTTAQLASLEAQLRPHFLFNALHSVGALMRLGRSEEARTALVTLGDLLRGTLDRSREGRSTLADELELCESYLDLERLRHGDRLTVTTTCPEEARASEVPPLLLLPLVENAVRHGLERTTEPVEVRIRVSLEDGRLLLAVENDGPPFPPEVLAAGQGQGIGLANTRKRIGTLYGARGSMALENPPSGGARAVLGLPDSRGSRDARS